MFEFFFNKPEDLEVYLLTVIINKMKQYYPTRNEIRALLVNLFTHLRFLKKDKTISKNEVVMNVAMWYVKKVNSYPVVFDVTNALVDMFPDMTVENENLIEKMVLAQKNQIKLRDISLYFQSEFNNKLENLIQLYSIDAQEYEISMSLDDSEHLDMIWFNNSHKMIQPLLIAYKNFKNKKGMLFQRKDITQIVIDYSIVICHNHYNYVGFLNNSICSEIIKNLTAATNECIGDSYIPHILIEEDVLNDLNYPSRIKTAFDFIKQL
ncbi:MAG: hypothetical protein U0T77_04070 [Chitinophagales bacterium]